MTEAQEDIVNLSEDAALHAISQGCCLQIHCDGGYKGDCGAAAFVVHLHRPRCEQVERLGFMGVFMAAPRSSFHAEIHALQMAVFWVRDKLLPHVHVLRQKRVRFE